MGLGERGDSVGLPDLLPRHPRFLLEGQPGAGKTTFLRFASCMLARDALRIPCSDGSSWRERYLGLQGGEAPTPVFVRISDLAAFLSKEEAPLRERPAPPPRFPRGAVPGERAPGRPRGVAPAARKRPGDPFPRRPRRGGREGDAAADLRGLPGRERALALPGGGRQPADSDGGAAGYGLPSGDSGAVRSVGDPDLPRSLGDRSYQVEGSEGLHGEGERYRAALLAAITDLPRVRRLAANPVMLTCLCVVHWNEGHLPEGRSRVYRAVSLADRGAHEAAGEGTLHRPFRLERPGAAGPGHDERAAGERTAFDLEDAAVAVDAAVAGSFQRSTRRSGGARRSDGWRSSAWGAASWRSCPGAASASGI